MSTPNTNGQMDSSNGAEKMDISIDQSSNGSSSSIRIDAGSSNVAAAISGPTITDIMTQLEEYTPTIPDAVTQHYLSTSGVQTDDPRIVRLVSLAAQKFISDIANDALQHNKMKNYGQASAAKKGKDRKFVLTTEDLSMALSDQGITLKKPPYYV